MNILVRLPNWLGDVVMSLPTLQFLRDIYPRANIEVIVKKGLEAIVERGRVADGIHTFSKQEYNGLKGAYIFGKQLSQQKQYDLFVCLPDSFSSGAMAYATKAKHKIGYKNELRSFLFSQTFRKPLNKHRVEEYLTLVQLYSKSELTKQYKPTLYIERKRTEPYTVINVNSEAISRKLPVTKAVELITLIQKHVGLPIKLIGGPGDVEHVKAVYDNLSSIDQVTMLAGKTSLPELIDMIGNASFMFSTDSGPAHIASAFETPLVTLFGAGNELNTGPYCNNKAIVVRNGKLPCEPCVKNTCKLQTLPLCLMEFAGEKLEDALIQLSMNSRTEKR